MRKAQLAIAAVLLSAISTVVPGQDVDKVLRVETELVSVSVAVKDAAGRSIKGLEASQFQIFDNGTRQRIEYFAKVEAGVTFGIVYDMHPTTADHTKAVLESLRNFTKSLAKDDDFFLLMFNERGSLLTEIVPDLDQLERHLARPEKREPRSLYDALALATDKLRQKKNIKRTLLVITDTADHNSQSSLNQLRVELRRSDMRVYAIVPARDLERSYAIDMNDDQDARLWSDASPSERSAMNSITLRSGGSTFPASLKLGANIEKILNLISADMHDQYAIGFYPSRQPDGKWHEIKIRLDAGRSGKGAVLTYRTGYQSGEPLR